MDAYARDSDSRVKQVSASLTGSWQAVQIMRADGIRVADIGLWCESISGLLLNRMDVWNRAVLELAAG
jgi:predicted Zn-dependent protease